MCFWDASLPKVEGRLKFLSRLRISCRIVTFTVVTLSFAFAVALVVPPGFSFWNFIFVFAVVSELTASLLNKLSEGSNQQSRIVCLPFAIDDRPLQQFSVCS